MKKCEICGKELMLFSGIKLKDNSIICKNCYTGIPRAFRTEQYAVLSDFKKGYDYGKEVMRQLGDIFRVSSSYGRMFLDEEHGMVCFCDATNVGKDGKLKHPVPDIYYCLALSEVDILVEPNTAKATRTSVECKITFTAYLGCGYNVHVREPLKKHALGKLLFDPSTAAASFSEPADLTVFRNIYNQMARTEWDKIRVLQENEEINLRKAEEAKLKLEEQRKQEEERKQEKLRLKKELENNLKLQRAEALYMLDKEYSLDDIKKQRMILMKTFHPDNGLVDSSSYAQKINEAFYILVEHVQSLEKRN